MKIGGIRAGLHDKDVRAAHVLQNLKIDLAIAEFSQLGFAGFRAQVPADFRT
jgi:hypothetical protein